MYTAKTATGAYAEYALALEEQVHQLPAKIDFEQGAGIWVPYGTAYHALYHSAKAHASETALVHGASGGVGIAALQIARAMGLMVLGTAGTPKGLEVAKREGAHQVFDHPTHRLGSAATFGGLAALPARQGQGDWPACRIGLPPKTNATVAPSKSQRVSVGNVGKSLRIAKPPHIRPKPLAEIGSLICSGETFDGEGCSAGCG